MIHSENLVHEYSRRDEEGNVTKSTDYALANPKIVSYTPKQSYLKTGEACLSVPEDLLCHCT